MPRIGLTAVLAVIGLLATGPASVQAKVDFVKQIKPLLERSCMKCHGAIKPKGKLRLDTRELTFKGGRSGEVIVPGDPDDSLLYELITLPADDDDVMPAEGKPLTKAETDLIRDWIKEGATWPDGVAMDDPVAEAAAAKAKVPTGVPITDAEKAAVAKVRASGALAIRLAQNVTWLRIDYQHSETLTDDGLSGLKAMPNLYELDLGRTPVTDAGLVHLKGVPNLSRLYLERTKVTSAGLANLAGLSNLTYLNLYATGVTDDGLEHLAGLEKLKNLYLWQTKVTDEGVAKLKKALPNLTVDRGWTLKPVEAKPDDEKKKEGEKKDDEKKK